MVLTRSEQGLILLDYLEANNPSAILQYETNPAHPFDKVIWPFLRPLMNFKAKGKVTHWWHWKDLPEDFVFEGELLRGNPGSFDLSSDNPWVLRLKRIQMSLGRRTESYVMGPKSGFEDIFYKEGIRCAFEGLGGTARTRQFCAVITKSPFVFLRGLEEIVLRKFHSHLLDHFLIEQTYISSKIAKLAKNRVY